MKGKGLLNNMLDIQGFQNQTVWYLMEIWKVTVSISMDVNLSLASLYNDYHCDIKVWWYSGIYSAMLFAESAQWTVLHVYENKFSKFQPSNFLFQFQKIALSSF